ncbi:beta-ketoacyl-ACP synthase III [Marinobacter gelidimuriae]|uniref:beta-ketoacyl-ACP synthase III n=1 Tax=Marinobacter gelidimuriae TaxID=2739064 RepID=UPI00037C82C6|nr:beta-ketoacyl-ACP synthase III [Marinobacter gelidimuriae]
MKNVYITAIAAALPNAPVGNDEIESVLGQAGAQPSRARRVILKSNKIKNRYYAVDPKTGERTHTNAKLTAEAIRALGDWYSKGIDCLVCGTSLPDQLMPSHAVMVHGELASPPCEVVATAGVCLAGMSALKYGWMSVATGQHQRVVCTGSEVASAVMRGKLFEPETAASVDTLENKPEVAFDKDFLRWMLSDGAGAVALEPTPAKEGLSLRVDWIDIRSFANQLDACMYAGARKREDGSLESWKDLPHETWLKESIFAVKQDVRMLNEHIVATTIEQYLPEVIEKYQLVADDIDWFLPHYSSGYFRERAYEGIKNGGLEIPFERWATNLPDKGNTGSASIYIMLEELYHSGKLEPGQKLLCWIPESGRFSSSFMMLTVCDHQDQS